MSDMRSKEILFEHAGDRVHFDGVDEWTFPATYKRLMPLAQAMAIALQKTQKELDYASMAATEEAKFADEWRESYLKLKASMQGEQEPAVRLALKALVAIRNDSLFQCAGPTWELFQRTHRALVEVVTCGSCGDGCNGGDMSAAPTGRKLIGINPAGVACFAIITNSNRADFIAWAALPILPKVET